MVLFWKLNKIMEYAAAAKKVVGDTGRWLIAHIERRFKIVESIILMQSCILLGTALALYFCCFTGGCL